METADRTGSQLGGARWSWMQIYVLALLTLVNLSNYLDRGVLAILQEPIKQDLKLQDWQLGIIGGPAFAIFYSVAGIPVARLADRLDRSRVLSVALGLWSLMTALCGAAHSFVQLALARLGVGAGEGACSPVSHSLISDLFDTRQRGMALAILTTSIPIGHMMAPLIGAIAASALGWRMAFVTIGVPGIVLALVFRATVKEPRHPQAAGVPGRQPARFRDDLALLARNRAFVWLFVATCFMGMAVSSVNVFTASYYLRTFHLSLAQAGAVIAIGMGTAGFAGTFLGGWLADRFAGDFGRSYPFVVAGAAALASLFFFVAFHVSTLVASFIFLLLANLASEMKNGPNYAAVQNLAPSHMRATAAAIIMIAVVVVGASGPLLVGLVSDQSAAQAFPATMGRYAAMCPGGRPLAGAYAAIAAACTDAAASGLKLGMLIPCICFTLAAPFFILSGAMIRERLVR